jgi:hypothetical protein
LARADTSGARPIHPCNSPFSLEYNRFLGSVLVALLKTHPDLDIVALVRHAKDVPKVAAVSPSRVTPLLDESGSHEVITAAAADADIVLDMADCDDVDLVRALILGLEARATAGATSTPVLIHTGGTGVTEVGKDAGYVEGKWYDVRLSTTDPQRSALGSQQFLTGLYPGGFEGHSCHERASICGSRVRQQFACASVYLHMARQGLRCASARHYPDVQHSPFGRIRRGHWPGMLSSAAGALVYIYACVGSAGKSAARLILWFK